MYCHLNFNANKEFWAKTCCFLRSYSNRPKWGVWSTATDINIENRKEQKSWNIRRQPTDVAKLGRLGQEPRQAPAYPNQPLSQLAIIAPWSTKRYLLVLDFARCWDCAKLLHLALMHLQDLNGTMEGLENSWCVVCHLHLLNLTYPLVNVYKKLWKDPPFY